MSLSDRERAEGFHLTSTTAVTTSAPVVTRSWAFLRHATEPACL